MRSAPFERPEERRHDSSEVMTHVLLNHVACAHHEGPAVDRGILNGCQSAACQHGDMAS